MNGLVLTIHRHLRPVPINDGLMNAAILTIHSQCELMNGSNRLMHACPDRTHG